MYRREGDKITLTLELDREEYTMLLALFGMATYHSIKNQGLSVMLGLINRLNEGNPEFRPYEISIPGGNIDVQ